MDKEKKKELREKYQNRHPKMGIIAWKSKDKIWIDTSIDCDSDYNRSIFQLNLGSWVNRDMQKEYNLDKDSFKFEVLKELEYEDYNEDHTEDLEILLLEVLEDYPNALGMKPKRKINRG